MPKHCIEHAVQALGSEQLTIAVVAEFSRGKSELINALFFADSGRRLLPTSPGRTTMCPTELFYDREADQAYISLLPIDTRGEDSSVAELRDDESRWHRIELDVDSPDQMEAAFQELVAVDQVSREDADILGLLIDDNDESDQVTIPRWRHALISFPHPLLQQGITILDTPGLNALGTEPELTLSMLPAAQAILFVVGADTGVTKSDLEIWRNHISLNQDKHHHGLAVVMNKIDTLWDDLRTVEDIELDIIRQATSTADMLDIPLQQVFPISAQKGLVAQIKGDDNLLADSRLPELESFLAEDVVAKRQHILLDTIENDIGKLLDTSFNTLEVRETELAKHVQQLLTLREKTEDTIGELMATSRSEQARHLKAIEGFESSRNIIAEQARLTLDMLDPEAMDKQLLESRRSMVDRWTTLGLRNSMQDLFDSFRSTVQEAITKTEQTNKLVESVYERFHAQHGIDAPLPTLLDLSSFQIELELRYKETEVFSHSSSMAATEQGFVIRSFFRQTVRQGRDVIIKLHAACEDWFRSALTPLTQVLREHKNLVERRLISLKTAGTSQEELDNEIKQATTELESSTFQLTQLAAIREVLTRTEQTIDNQGEEGIDERAVAS